MKKGLLIILSGPSGVGKGTVRKYIMKRNALDLTFSISMTTRAPRATETNGVEYYFVSKEEFQKNIDEDNFLEWAEFVGNRYGTPKSYVEELRNQGKNVILEIEITGAEQVLKKVKDDRVLIQNYFARLAINRDNNILWGIIRAISFFYFLNNPIKI